MTGFISGNWYKELSEKFGQAIGIAESEPFLNQCLQNWQVHIFFPSGLGSIPHEWLEAA